MGLPVYKGSFDLSQAERLIWRTGFGPKPGQVDEVVKAGLASSVESLLHPGNERLSGPSPHGDDKERLHPNDTWGDDHLWWMDKMVRSNRQLTERMTLVWHDWFATSNAGVGSQNLMLKQNMLLRREALGNFKTLFTDITRDPAMLLWLNGTSNSRWSPNENYGREMMELFSLGAGKGYTENDVREQAKALTGWRNDWDSRPTNFRFDKNNHDDGQKIIFGKRGNFNWKDSVRLCVEHNAHPSFFISKLWGYFIPTPPSSSDLASLESLYKKSGYEIKPVLRAILLHPQFHKGPRMIKPPIVQQVGMLRALGRGIDTGSWSWIAELSGQKLFFPPNVAGWDDNRWLDTATFHGRWIAVQYALQPKALNPDKWKTLNITGDPDSLVNGALEFWGNPTITQETRNSLISFSKKAFSHADANWKKDSYPVLIANALRVLYAISPDYMTA
jgi:uncharacterized protein (DUF1800 family)